MSLHRNEGKDEEEAEEKEEEWEDICELCFHSQLLAIVTSKLTQNSAVVGVKHRTLRKIRRFSSILHKVLLLLSATTLRGL